MVDAIPFAQNVKGKSMRLTLLAILLLGGCAALDEKIMDLQMRGLESKPAAFKEGYRAGCASGFRSAGNVRYSQTKDVVRFDNDAEYADGWEQAFKACRKSESNR